MRERLDCALIRTRCTDAWAGRWAGVHAGGRLHIECPASPADTQVAGSSGQLASWSMLLRRFDICMVPVAEYNLVWVRTCLRIAQGRLQTPVVALVRDIKAAALDDLFALGLSDFVRDPLCPEELRVRIERLLDGYRAAYPARGNIATTERGLLAEGKLQYSLGNPANISEDEMCSTILERTGLELDAFAVASASRCSTTKESFRAAKGKIIERFERAYIRAALNRHSGNIAMAARSAQKHRRAFWALMRKYEIDAAPYRTESRFNPPPDN